MVSVTYSLNGNAATQMEAHATGPTDYYEPDIDHPAVTSCRDPVTHHAVPALPARVRKSRDNVKAEGGVLLAERWSIPR